MASNYLARLATKGIDYSQVNPEQIQQQLIELTHQVSVAAYDSVPAAEAALVEAKANFAAGWAQLELAQFRTHKERGAMLSHFADVTIDAALQSAWRATSSKHSALAKVANQPLKGLFVLGLGKLGGNDLNFSSDVDLIGYFDPEIFPVPNTIGVGFVAHQVLQLMTKILSQSGGLNFIWRVDWRLRPNASATTLAMSVPAALDYYFYHASPWHRLALLKGRVIAGDLKAGVTFFKAVHPFIWRQNLDYRSLDELAEIKHRINLEHPSLKSERAWNDPIQPNVAGFNVKLGRGGIREIEFVVNAIQLVWGGRKTALQVSNTMEALNQLKIAKLISSEEAETLQQAYEFLRRLENALQLYDNNHTHIVPGDDGVLGEVKELLGVDDWDEYVSQLNQYRSQVNDIFAELFADHDEEVLEPIVWPSDLSERADSIIELWESGYQAYGVSIEARGRLRPLTLALSKYLRERKLSAADIDATVVRLHDYFRRLPKGEQYFRLLAQSPQLLEAVIAPLRDSPAMSILLEQSPHIIDRYLEPIWRYPEDLPSSNEVLNKPSYDAKLDGLRRFVNEHLYLIYWQFLQGEVNVEQLQGGLTLLAQRALTSAIDLVVEDLGVKESPVSVLALGKLGLQKMAPMSDLDLVFVYDEDTTDLDTATRFVSRLQTAVATKMREGVVYDLDTRLRPSGRSGAPTVSVASLVAHHLQRAHTWEHIAFMFARFVAGSNRVKESIETLKTTLLARPRDTEQLDNDVVTMWKRIEEHRIRDLGVGVFNSKLGKGGLMQAEFFAAAQLLRTPSVQSTSQDFSALVGERLSPALSGGALDAMEHWRLLQIYERLLGLEGLPYAKAPQRYRAQLLEHAGVKSIQDLSKLSKAHADFVVDELQKDFYDSKHPPHEWVESSVNWLD